MECSFSFPHDSVNQYAMEFGFSLFINSWLSIHVKHWKCSSALFAGIFGQDFEARIAFLYDLAGFFV